MKANFKRSEQKKSQYRLEKNKNLTGRGDLSMWNNLYRNLGTEQLLIMKSLSRCFLYCREERWSIVQVS